MKQKLLPAYVFHRGTRRAALTSITQTIALSWSQTWTMLPLIPILIAKIPPHTHKAAQRADAELKVVEFQCGGQTQQKTVTYWK